MPVNYNRKDNEFPGRFLTVIHSDTKRVMWEAKADQMRIKSSGHYKLFYRLSSTSPNYWFVDSEAKVHMINKKSWLPNCKEIGNIQVTLANNENIIGKGIRDITV